MGCGNNKVLDVVSKTRQEATDETVSGSATLNLMKIITPGKVFKIKKFLAVKRERLFVIREVHSFYEESTSSLTSDFEAEVPRYNSYT